jgi:enamine deaminase RidA (YjgF/YER057c/UK114 family)
MREAYAAARPRQGGGGATGPRGPAATMIQVAALAHPGYLIEIEAIAIV